MNRVPLVIVLLILTASAGAQNALDAGQTNRAARPERRASPVPSQTYVARGRALDANLQQGAGGFNAPVANFQQELALRNAIVTGNVAGGKAFRGDIGYTAADDFRGDTGSDDLFEFQRDSAYSGLVTQNIRGISPLKLQMTQTTAGQTEGFAGGLIVRRSAAALSAAEATGIGPVKATVDPFGEIRGSLRSTSDALLRNARFPLVLGPTGRPEEGAGRLYYISNPLVGVKPITLGNSLLNYQERPDLVLDEKFRGAGRKEEDKAKAEREGVAEPVGRPFEPTTPFDAVRKDLALKADTFVSRRFGEKGPEDLEKEKDGEKPKAPPTTESIEQRYDRMIEELRQSFRKRLEESAPPAEAPKEAGEESPGAAEGPRTLSSQEIIERARGLLDNGEVRLSKLLAEEGVDDLYSWHMRKGEEATRAQRWFEAEERFTSAIRANPGDAMAAAARVNAQVGGSLFLSAAVNLRNLFSAYPELVAARYDAALFPGGSRLDAIRLALRDRLKADTLYARDAALVLAYVGWQTQSSPDVADAFAALDQFHKDAGEEWPALELVLREVWLDQ